ncbi:MAG: hypothetical protein LBH69_03195 [Methanomassiliicoccaceae archaeon]|nr:hypothetical protein [Methanomassiliicoccaceae archaeon]
MERPSVVLSADELRDEPYASVLCYPRAEASEIERRISELKALGVTHIEFSGSGLAGEMPVLGKGYVGVVVIAYIGDERLALKMRRIDGGRESFFHEAEMLQTANAAGVGPRFSAVSENFLLSQIIGGGTLAEWMRINKKKTAFRNVLKDILEQCRRLDDAGLDHGELSKAPKHILMHTDGTPYIIDFETASANRKASIVSSVCQFLFLSNSDASKLIREVLGDREREQILKAARDHKRERSKETFEALLRACI